MNVQYGQSTVHHYLTESGRKKQTNVAVLHITLTDHPHLWTEELGVCVCHFFSFSEASLCFQLFSLGALHSDYTRQQPA